jgi:hypothetical protein
MQKMSTVPAERSVMKENSELDIISSYPNTQNISRTETIDQGDIKISGDIELQKTIEGNAHFHQLGWKRLTVVLIVNAIALGSLGIPSAFASLGMVVGIVLCLALG